MGFFVSYVSSLLLSKHLSHHFKFSILTFGAVIQIRGNRAVVLLGKTFSRFIEIHVYLVVMSSNLKKLSSLYSRRFDTDGKTCEHRVSLEPTFRQGHFFYLRLNCLAHVCTICFILASPIQMKQEEKATAIGVAKKGGAKVLNMVIQKE